MRVKVPRTRTSKRSSSRRSGALPRGLRTSCFVVAPSVCSAPGESNCSIVFEFPHHLAGQRPRALLMGFDSAFIRAMTALKKREQPSTLPNGKDGPARRGLGPLSPCPRTPRPSPSPKVLRHARALSLADVPRIRTMLCSQGSTLVCSRPGVSTVRVSLLVPSFSFSAASNVHSTCWE
jgi:hypothetical protein